MSHTFHLQQHLNTLYETASRKSGWAGQTDDAFWTWQHMARGKLLDILCIDPNPPASQRPAQLLEETKKDGYTQAQWSIPGRDDIDINTYMLTPDTPGPHQPVLVFHGHNPSVQYCMGNYPSEETEQRMVAKQGDYARVLAQSGHLVVAVEQRGFGLRQSDGHNQRPEVANTDRHIALFYQLHGKTLLGERVDDGRAVIDWLAKQEHINLDRLAVTGQSGGGTTSLYLAAVDERLQIVIPSCGMSSMRESILSEHFSHCLCNYIPGILAHFESGDIAACIAPRPLRLIQGNEDHIFPIEAAKEQARLVASAYTAANAPTAFDLFIHPDGHRFDHHGAQSWIAQWSR